MVGITHTMLDKLRTLTQELDAMHIAQLTSFAYGLPPLYLCREYLNNKEKDAINQCLIRLGNGIENQAFTFDKLATLLAEKDFYDDYEARLRLAPAPE